MQRYLKVREERAADEKDNNAKEKVDHFPFNHGDQFEERTKRLSLERNKELKDYLGKTQSELNQTY